VLQEGGFTSGEGTEDSEDDFDTKPGFIWEEKLRKKGPFLVGSAGFPGASSEKACLMKFEDERDHGQQNMLLQ
jgi:hypothetical protein